MTKHCNGGGKARAGGDSAGETRLTAPSEGWNLVPAAPQPPPCRRRAYGTRPGLLRSRSRSAPGSEDAREYIEVSFKVAERSYAPWLERIRLALERVCTVRTGKPTYRVAKLSETARRDSRHTGPRLPLGVGDDARDRRPAGFGRHLARHG
jgi:hypothetical protein